MKRGKLFVYHSYCPKCGMTLTHYSTFYNDKGKRIYNLGYCGKCNNMMKLKKDPLVLGVNSEE